jgi:hypothetical protein
MAYRKDQTGPGFVYAMRPMNPANRNEFKVGLTIDPELRRLGLSGTASPLPYVFERVWAVTNMALAEDIAHKMLEEQTMNTDREHFICMKPFSAACGMNLPTRNLTCVSTRS